MNVLASFGVSESNLSDHSARANYPKMVTGRTAHIDADFLAYQVSAESKDELDPSHPKKRKSLADMHTNTHNAVGHISRLCGAEFFHLHTTPTGSNKGGRAGQAILKEYQGNRKDSAAKPEFLDEIRAYLIREVPSGANKGTAHLDQEADDGMAQAAWGATDPNLCVIASKDKDLLMVKGLHLVKDKVVGAKDDFGHVYLDDTTSTKTCKGLGTAFFWAQLLMGDTADNISGLPLLTGRLACEYLPTKAYNDCMHKWATATKRSVITTAEKKLEAMYAKHKPVGQVAAYGIMSEVHSDGAAFYMIRDMYTALGKTGHKFVHWSTGAEVTPTQAMLSDMQLLWMRRDKNPNDVVVWLKEQLRAFNKTTNQ